MPQPATDLCTANLLSLICDLKDALEFDAENCDFGPAYGLWKKDRARALTQSKKVLSHANFVRLPQPPEPKKREVSWSTRRDMTY